MLSIAPKFSLRFLTLLGLLLGVGACTPPIQAPTQFDELCSFIFSHGADEDEQGLVDGVANLQTWLAANRAEVLEGYVVDNLDAEIVKSLDGNDHDLADLLGVGFSREFPYSLEQSLQIALTDEPAEQDPELWKSYVRSNVTDLDCFLEKRCDTLDYDVTAEQLYPLGLESKVSYHANLRRVETAVGTAVIWRNWLNGGPNEFNWDWIEIKLSFYMSVSMENAAGTMERTEVTWMLANMGESPVPHDVALSLTLDTVKASAERHHERLAEVFGTRP